MEKREQLYEGKAKKVFATDEEGVLIQEFKDDATASCKSAKPSGFGPDTRPTANPIPIRMTAATAHRMAQLSPWAHLDGSRDPCTVCHLSRAFMLPFQA